MAKEIIYNPLNRNFLKTFFLKIALPTLVSIGSTWVGNSIESSILKNLTQLKLN